MWVRADSRNGYFLQFEVYTGKKKGAVEHQLGARVVKELTKELQGKRHHVYFDNFFYTSYSLLSDLENSGINRCGTARNDRRGFPGNLKKAKFKNR